MIITKEDGQGRACAFLENIPNPLPKEIHKYKKFSDGARGGLHARNQKFEGSMKVNNWNFNREL